uniref:Uncharacterized protein n=1 Tax=Molossus molossus TaxID=27622 RepID=A0A7J8I009_MOLMO|nr:hypothetical protein HJG59_010868 [Molossus molossus]
MQDTIAAPEVAEEWAEPGQQHPAAYPPSEEEPPWPGELSAQEVADSEDQEAEARPGPEALAEPMTNGEEATGLIPGLSLLPPEVTIPVHWPQRRLRGNRPRTQQQKPSLTGQQLGRGVTQTSPPSASPRTVDYQKLMRH